jgi:hypothetical protein
MPPSECPVCGGAVPRKAKACPHCGADERSGWDDDSTRYDGLDLPDSAFDDDGDRPAKRSTFSKQRARGGFPHPIWILVALGLVIWFAIRALTMIGVL